VTADLPNLQKERAKQGWHIPTDPSSVKVEETSGPGLKPRKPTKLEMAKDTFISLARKYFTPLAPAAHWIPLGSREFPLKTTSAGVTQVQWLDMCSLLLKAGFYIVNWPDSLAFPYSFRTEKNKGLATIGEDNYWAFYTAIKSSENSLDLIRAGSRTKGLFP
jgi:hypothetical protein